jgi:hypothetical protein
MLTLWIINFEVDFNTLKVDFKFKIVSKWPQSDFNIKTDLRAFWSDLEVELSDLEIY